MSWLFSQVLVEEYSEESFSDGELFAPLNGTPMPQAFLWRDKTTDAWSRFPSGMMCKPLTASHGEAALMSFLAAFPAQISVALGKAQASTEKPAGCGDTWPASLAKFDPASSSWRTHQCLLFEDSTECLATLPRWGMMRGGELWELTTPVLPTDETESGLWPTPRAQEPGSTTEGYGRGLKELIEGKSQKPCKWPTPRSCTAMAATITPESAWAENRFPNLETMVGRRLWPTSGANEDSYRLGGNSQQSKSLGAMARREALAEQPESGGQLNPTWVEWLMGWPLGWTDCAALATARFRQWCDSHGTCSPQQLDTSPQTH